MTQSIVRTRVGLIDDDTLMRAAFTSLLPEIDVVAAAATVRGLLNTVRQSSDLDVTVLDLNLNGVNAQAPTLHGRKAIELLTGLGHRVLLYTNESRPTVLLRCLGAGAQGLIHKADPLPRLLEAIETVHQGGMVVTTAVAGLTEAATDAGLILDLSNRQLEVLRGRARGEPFQSIAQRLYITKKTAEDHMSAVTRKFASYLAHHSPADLERELGITQGDLLA